MLHYYNEFDPNAAAWLRELIAQKLIPDGIVDERSITEIQPHELAPYVQCHFFCGIGGWPLALQLAGWDPARPVGTGSCPCQPYSAAGKGLGDKDPRNLWPAFRDLIIGCRDLGQPWALTVFGEQVESAIGHGWLDGLSTDMEGEGYTVGAVVLGAHSAGADHIRQRLYWVADHPGGRREMAGIDAGSCDAPHAIGQAEINRSGGPPAPRLADAGRPGHEGRPTGAKPGRRPNAQGSGTPRRLADSFGERLQEHAGNGDRGDQPGRIDTDAAGSTAAGGATGGRVADAQRDAGRTDEPERGSEGRATDGRTGGGTDADGMANTNGRDASAERQQCGGEQRLQPEGHWSDSYFILCRDGKHRRVPVESSLFPLSDGIPYKLARRRSIRPALLKGAGNAIVPAVAAAFIQAYEEAREEMIAETAFYPEPQY